MSRRSVLVSTLLLFLVWEAAARLLRISVLPPASAVLLEFARDLPGELGRHFVISTWRVVASIVLTVVLATPAGLAIGQSQTWNRRLSALIYLTYPIPKVVLLPIILLFLGIGDASKIFLIWLILFYQVLLVVRDASAGVHPDLVQSVASLGSSRLQLLRFVFFPACLPAILTGLRVSVGTAIAVLFLAESIATSSGLGYFIMVEGWGRLDYEAMYAGVVAMSVLGLALYALLERIERVACPWTAIRAPASVA
jgi:NitT/TauT family transport system permease protein